jgi:hypothetical protein
MRQTLVQVISLVFGNQDDIEETIAGVWIVYQSYLHALD